jgi:hypothetical protein
MEYLWPVVIGALAILLALILDSYIGLSGILRKKPVAVSAAA